VEAGKGVRDDSEGDPKSDNTLGGVWAKQVAGVGRGVPRSGLGLGWQAENRIRAGAIGRSMETRECK